MDEPAGLATIRHNDLTIVRGYEAALSANHVDSLNALFNLTSAERLTKQGLSPWRERLRLPLNVDGEQRTFYLKRFRHPPRGARRELRWSASGASSIAGMEWTWCNRLAADGIACVKPVAFGEEFQGEKELRSAILTEAVPGKSLERWVPQWGDADHSTIRSLIAPLASLVARFHAAGYVHRDLYLSHVFYDPAPPLSAEGESLHLIDLQRVARPRRRRQRWIIKDLASLSFSAPPSLISNTERIRWLTHYLGISKLDASARRLVYRVVGKTRWIERHEQRRTARRRIQSEG